MRAGVIRFQSLMELDDPVRFAKRRETHRLDNALHRSHSSSENRSRPMPVVTATVMSSTLSLRE